MLARELGRTVAELEATVTETELQCWFALMEVESHEAKMQAQAAKNRRR